MFHLGPFGDSFSLKAKKQVAKNIFSSANFQKFMPAAKMVMTWSQISSSVKLCWSRMLNSRSKKCSRFLPLSDESSMNGWSPKASHSFFLAAISWRAKEFRSLFSQKSNFYRIQSFDLSIYHKAKISAVYKSQNEKMKSYFFAEFLTYITALLHFSIKAWKPTNGIKPVPRIQDSCPYQLLC